ncbi:helix-turn-helix domain-containing protein [Thiocapsa bogorovii]|uniref:helix-turn-helix domain-containing protein n=1 Tax=Thiocapsa bogorovii TaxID=521689 RepID=UPI0038CDA3F5
MTAAVAEVRHRWGGAEYYIQAIDREHRDREARELLAKGESLEDVARRVGCSTSTIRRRQSRWL